MNTSYITVLIFVRPTLWVKFADPDHFCIALKFYLGTYVHVLIIGPASHEYFAITCWITIGSNHACKQ